MGIVPISGIPILTVEPAPSDSGLSGVVRVEFQRESQQDSYSPHREGADRGPEDEQTDPEALEQQPDSSELQASPDIAESDNQISFFA